MSSAKINKQEALEYHSTGKPGKIEVIPTKAYSTQRDLSLAYSPGVAEPCLEIAKKSFATTRRIHNDDIKQLPCFTKIR